MTRIGLNTAKDIVSLHCPDDISQTFLKKKQTEEEYMQWVEAGFILSIRSSLAAVKSSKVLVIEPHSDDGALSAGGTLINLAETGAGVSSLCLFSKGGGAEIEDLRQRENELVFTTILDGEAEFAGLTDAIYRQNTVSEFFQVRKKIEHKVKLYQPDLVLAPLGVGEHVDHLMVHMAITGLYKSNRNFDLWFYEDFPYSNNDKYYFCKRLLDVKEEIYMSPKYMDISDRLEDKVSLAMAYLSQHDKKRSEIRESMQRFGEAVGVEGILLGHGTTRLHCYERFWVCQ